MRLPKEFVGLKFDQLLIIEVNGFDIDMLLPAYFWMVRSNGKQRGESKERDPAALQSRLVAHEKLHGFDREGAERVLGKWLRTSIIQTVKTGRGGRGREEVSYAKPLTFLAYKGPGPKGGSLRQTHLFLHDLLTRLSLSRGEANSLRDLMLRSFARGVHLDEGSSKDGRYDGRSLVDLEVLLSLYYLDGLPGPRESTARTAKPSEPVCPMAARTFAEDVALFLTIYGHRLSPTSLARHLATLLNFEFFHYTLNVFKGTNALVNGLDAPELSRNQSESKLGLYADLTQDRGARSLAMAQACANRDLEEAESYLRSSLYLRTIHTIVSEISELRQKLQDKDGCDRIRAIFDLRDHADVGSDARSMLRKLRNHFESELEEGEDLPMEINDLLTGGETPLDSVVNTLYHFQHKSAVKNAMKWIQWTGGTRRGDGILDGTLRARRYWRYSMSDSLLEVLCMIAAASPEVQEASGTRGSRDHEPRPILLSAFLQFVKKRYGILIAEPPPFEHGSEALAAAKDNLGALRRRLRQMGLFQDLSDDFNAQRVEPRYPDAVPLTQDDRTNLN